MKLNGEKKMNSEKVKEIKTALECCRHSIKGGCKDCPYHNPNEDCQEFLIWNMEDYINELESENETLRNAKVVYETVDYCYEDLKKAEKRIAELEKENGELLKENEGYHGSYRCAIDKIGELSAERYIKVEQFAEMLKEKLVDKIGYDRPYVMRKIDETLKECIND
jgi:hypothetical protein